MFNLIHQKKSIIFLSVFTSLILIFIFRTQIEAVTRSFIQTTWLGGADTVNNANDTNLVNWTKFYSATDGVDATTAGEFKLKVSTTQP